MIGIAISPAISQYDSAAGGDALMSALLAAGAKEAWDLGETSGAIAAAQVLSPTRDGAYANVTQDNTDGPISGHRAGLWAPANLSTVNLYSASLATVFSATEGTLLVWARVPSATWTDSTARNLIYFAADSNNFIRIHRGTINDNIQFRYRAGGTTTVVSHVSSGPTGWLLLAITWHKISDTVKAYLLEDSGDGQIETSETGLGVWAGSLDSDTTVVGASAVASPGQVMSGNLAYPALYDKELTEAQIQAIMASTE